MYICLRIPKIKDGISLGRREFCIEIPIVPPRPKRIPWLVLDEKPFEFAEDLQVLATIADLAPVLRPEFGKILSAGIDQIFSALTRQLPEGVELRFHEGTHAECAE